MKKNTLLVQILLITSLSFGQITTDPGTGNVGIGTTSPATKLDVVGDVYIDNVDWSTDNAIRIREGGSNSYGAFFKYGLNDLLTIGTRHIDSDYIAFQMSRGSTNVTFNGNVGIGIASPTAKLEVNGNGQFNGAVISSISDIIGGQIDLENPTKMSNGIAKNWRIYNMTGVYGNSLQFWAYDNLGCVSGGMCNNRFTIMDNGDIGIGTITPGYKLDVIGTIRSREIKVDLLGADFVFENEYKLMPLNQLEKFIKENKHLPEIAPAKEMQQKGVSLGEMSNLLLQKVEELTLYAIEQETKNILQSKQIDLLIAEIQKLKKKRN